ncbi:uncharacterized protein LOC135383623 [Ornithodoros turicata]|uniref:uncharacterized protein LOC135383623 n=1 Tax=Ornithodoros turicata TaxID=34597 RepID=UPI003139E2BF
MLPVLASFEVEEYAGSLNGVFTILEVLFGILLYFLMARSTMTTKTETFLYSVSYAYVFNGMHILVSGSISLYSAYVLEHIFYYEAFLMSATITYVVGSTLLVREANMVTFRAIVGLLVGIIHAVHFIATFLTLYITK